MTVPFSHILRLPSFLQVYTKHLLRAKHSVRLFLNEKSIRNNRLLKPFRTIYKINVQVNRALKYLHLLPSTTLHFISFIILMPLLTINFYYTVLSYKMSLIIQILSEVNIQFAMTYFQIISFHSTVYA